MQIRSEAVQVWSYSCKSLNLCPYICVSCYLQVTHFGLHALPVPGASSPSLSTLIASAPEVLEDGAERPTALHPSSDVYSFGVLLWEMWCGQHPFLGLDAPKLIELVTSAKQFPLAMPPGTPQQLVVSRATLELQPRNAPQPISRAVVGCRQGMAAADLGLLFAGPTPSLCVL